MEEDKVKKVQEAFKIVTDTIDALRAAHHELGSIRATLLLNFGEKAAGKFGVTIKDEGTTLNLMMQVIGALLALEDVK